MLYERAPPQFSRTWIFENDKTDWFMNSTPTSSKLAIVKKEISDALAKVNFALYIASSDTKTRYRRSVLGPLWLVLGTLIGVGGLGIVWSTLFEVDRGTFIPSLAIGLVTWYLLTACIVDSASAFYGNRDIFLNMQTSSILVSLLILIKNLINFAHNFVVVIIVLMIYPKTVGFVSLLAIPGLILVSFNLLGVIQLLGFVGARYRDLAPLLAAVMQPLFFITPVLFRPQQLGANAFIAELNPFTYWLSLIRDPIMGNAPTGTTWLIVILMTVLTWAAALLMTANKRHRLAYWVH